MGLVCAVPNPILLRPGVATVVGVPNCAPRAHGPTRLWRGERHRSQQGAAGLQLLPYEEPRHQHNNRDNGKSNFGPQRNAGKTAQ